jgi:hypothetical protein
MSGSIFRGSTVTLFLASLFCTSLVSLRSGENNVNALLAYITMKESRFVVTVNRVLNVIFASGLLVFWLALPPLLGTQETNFMKIIPNKIQPISISYVPRTMFYNIRLFNNCHCN